MYICVVGKKYIFMNIIITKNHKYKGGYIRRHSS